MLFHSFTILRSHNNKKYGVQFTTVVNLSGEEIISYMYGVFIYSDNKNKQCTQSKNKHQTQGIFTKSILSSCL